MNNNKEIGVEAVNTMEGITMNKEQEKYEIVATGSGEVTEKKADTLESEAVTMQKDTKDNDNMENMSLEGQEMGEMKDTYEIRKVTEDENIVADSEEVAENAVVASELAQNTVPEDTNAQNLECVKQEISVVESEKVTVQDNTTIEVLHEKVNSDAQKKVEYMKKLETEQELPPVTGEEKNIALLKCEKNGNEYILYATIIMNDITKVVKSIDTFLYDCAKKEPLIGDDNVSFTKKTLLNENANYKCLNPLKNYNVDISVDQLSLAFERLMMYIDKGKSISSGDNYSILEVYKEIMKQKDFIVKNYEGCEKSSYHGKKVLKITSEAFQKILKEYGYKVISFMKGLAKHEAIEDKKYYYATENRYALTEKNNTRRYCLVIPEENTTTLDNNCAA